MMGHARSAGHRPPRVLTLTPDYPPDTGGIQLLLGRLHEHLLEYEHHVITRAARTSGQPLEGVVRTRATRGKRSLAELNLLGLREAGRFRPDVVLNGHVVTTPAALLIGQVLGVPVVTYVYADELAASPLLARWAVRRSAMSIAISSYAQQLALESGATRARVRIIAPGLDQPARLRHTAKASRPTIVTVARLVDRFKGHDIMLDAVARLRESLPDVHWVVIGTGPLRVELESRATALGLQRNVSFLGHTTATERDRQLAAAHVFAMPGRLPPGGRGGEGFGIVYLEAALLGTPSIAGRAAGAPDAVVHEATGLLVDSVNRDDVAAALLRILTDTALAARLGDAARIRARTFTWEAMAGRVDGVIKDVLERR